MDEKKYQGVTPTLNNFGYMFNELDEYSQAFVDYCDFHRSPVLDIGAAFGIASLAAHDNGVDVIACDISAKHLSAIVKKTDHSKTNKLIIKEGKIPTNISFNKNQFYAIHAGLILHFLTPMEIIQSISKIYDWLKPKGKVFITMCTPYHGTLKQFIPIYEKRKKRGDLWPGVITNLNAYMPHRKREIPQYATLVEDKQIARCFIEAKFKIEKCSMFTKNNIPEDIKLDDREFVGLIATK